MRSFCLLLLALAACSGGEAPSKPAEKPPEAPATETPATPPAKLTLEELKVGATATTIVPSPVETQRALSAAGVNELTKQMTERKFKLDVPDKDIVAVRTGVILADTLLMVKDLPDDKLVANLTQVKDGLNNLGAGKDLGNTIDDLIARVQNKAVSRDDLLKELDELHGAVIPEISFEAGERAVPLIQAGSWLEGASLVSKAVVAANKPEAASMLLRQPQVVEYFQKYVKENGQGKAPPEVIKQLEATLAKLGEISAKPALTLDDVKEIQSQTDAVLALL